MTNLPQQRPRALLFNLLLAPLCKPLRRLLCAPLLASLLAASLLAAFALPLPAQAQAPAQDRAEVERTRIIGNRELPKVLYIVPWKKPLPGELAARPVTSVLDEALAPIDRDVFRRQVQYDGQAKAPVAAGAPGAPAAPPK